MIAVGDASLGLGSQSPIGSFVLRHACFEGYPLQPTLFVVQPVREFVFVFIPRVGMEVPVDHILSEVIPLFEHPPIPVFKLRRHIILYVKSPLS